jgi:hypothetical protein
MSKFIRCTLLNNRSNRSWLEYVIEAVCNVRMNGHKVTKVILNKYEYGQVVQEAGNRAGCSCRCHGDQGNEGFILNTSAQTVRVEVGTGPDRVEF